MRLSGTKTGSINQYNGLGDQLYDIAGERPTLDLNFAGKQSLKDQTTGNSLVTHSRSSNATYVGGDGLIKDAVTNLLVRSEEFDNAIWTPSSLATSITPNNTTAPDGTLTADLVAGVSAAADQCVQALTVDSGEVYTISGYIKPNTSTLTRFGIFQSPATWVGAVDVLWTAGVPSTSATHGSPSNITYTPVGNGWYRCSLTATATSTSHQIHFHPVPAGTITKYNYCNSVNLTSEDLSIPYASVF